MKDKKQAFNPYLPGYEYIPDGEPCIFGNRLYVYGSHDCFDGTAFCQNDYVCWSAPIDNLGDWRYEGVIYLKTQDPLNRDGNHCMYAPDVVQGADNRYYLYYALDMLGIMSIAVADTPAGPYMYYGNVKYSDGRVAGTEKGDVYHFDPGVLKDDDGKIYLYTGFGAQVCEESDMQLFQGRKYAGAYCMELENDMCIVKTPEKMVIPQVAFAEDTSFEKHPFFEASSIRKIKDKYYFVYSSTYGHELCYAISDKPNRDYIFGGVLISNGDVGLNGRMMLDAVNYMGNNHGGMVEINGQWYIFYHRQTNRHQFSRQGCAEPIEILADGKILQVEMTSCGLNGKALQGIGGYSAGIVCNLRSKSGAVWIDQTKEDDTHPYLTQMGVDGENKDTQYIANMQDGSAAGFKYFDLEKTNRIMVRLKGSGGKLIVTDGPDGKMLANIILEESEIKSNFGAALIGGKSRSSLFFKYEGDGIIDFYSFLLS